VARHTGAERELLRRREEAYRKSPAAAAERRSQDIRGCSTAPAVTLNPRKKNHRRCRSSSTDFGQHAQSAGPTTVLRCFGVTVGQSASFTNEYEFLAAWQGNGGADTVRNVALELRIEGQNVTVDSTCLDGSGEPLPTTALVHHASFLEDSDREEASPTAAQAPPE
jgi:hypothetical protein